MITEKTIHFDMKPAARLERECYIVCQLFDGYGGFVYEVANRWSYAVLFHFAFRGDRWPDDENAFETVCDLKDGIYWLKNYGKNIPEYKRWIRISTF